jgi:branched-chain amino acid transport system ATP-binding protein
MPSSGALLTLEQVSVCYGQVEVVHAVSLRIGEAEIVALTGPNGAGKTTLLRAISGLTPASGGAIHFGGRPIERLPTYRIAGLGIAHVPEGRVVFGDQTVEDNLLLGAFQRWFSADRAAIRRDAERLMERFPVLGRRRAQLAGLLSGGEQQQLAIARGLMSRPRLLLLDEPSLGLAPALVGQVFDGLADLRAAGVGVLLVEQHALRALAVATRGYVLQAGRVRVEGPSAELRQDPSVARAYLGPGRP